MNTKLLVTILLVLAIGVVVACYLPIGGSTVADRVVGSAVGPESTWDYYSYSGFGTWIKTDKFINASTTIVSIKNPTGDVAAVDYVGLDITGAATSTYTIACGTSTTAYDGTSIPVATVINSGTIATGTKTMIVNNIGGGTASTSDNGLARMQLKSTEHLVCNVSTLYSGAFTEVTNAFDGKYIVRFIR